ncbi:hypothetical protein GOL30_04655 [Sinorhizobium medicae]|nr:hypothetical protein [Sinorhizobium medicae]MDX0443634.1 hypothetical protein [Sinorhizobium medicae]MDX0461600.1 hypothetical protein [Sinorhizobium medicae]MDX0534948.1 hypothetical protein [Sinorhizobium medicae]MDX0573289.1 hypothetical protein [Sinorhizobium medicae]
MNLLRLWRPLMLTGVRRLSLVGEVINLGSAPVISRRARAHDRPKG